MTYPHPPSPAVPVGGEGGHWRLTWINQRPVFFIQSGGQVKRMEWLVDSVGVNICCKAFSKLPYDGSERLSSIFAFPYFLSFCPLIISSFCLSVSLSLSFSSSLVHLSSF